MQLLLHDLTQLTDTPITILFSGETGTGKTTMAHWFHQQSNRHRHRFVVLDCGAVPESLFERELYGHCKGAFTGATGNAPGLCDHAHHGTLFLDEIENLSLVTQSKVLTMVDEQAFRPVGSTARRALDARVLAATNIDLVDQVERRLFRADLFHRISGFVATLLPLRERRADLPAITTRYLQEIAAVLQRNVAAPLSSPVMQAIHAYHWPGNLRELYNRLLAGCLRSIGRALRVEDLSLGPDRQDDALDDDTTLAAYLSSCRHRYIERLLTRYAHDLPTIARVAGVSRMTVWRWLEQAKPAGGG